ncbi:MAG: AAA family ATPase [Sulfuricurvum sp.]
MELVYLWVEEYKNIKQQGFNFSGRYRCDYDGENLTIEENKEYVHIFPENINVTAIVGKNGSGKSSIAEVILRAVAPTITVFYIDGEFRILGPKDIKTISFQANNLDKNLFRTIYIHTDIIKPYEIVDWASYFNYGEFLSNPYNQLLKQNAGFWHLDLQKFQSDFYELILKNFKNFKSDIFNFVPSSIFIKTRKLSLLDKKLRVDINEEDNHADEFVFSLGKVEAIANAIFQNSNQSTNYVDHFLAFLLNKYLMNISTIDQLNRLGLYEEAMYIDSTKMTNGEDGLPDIVEGPYYIADFQDAIMKYSYYIEDNDLYEAGISDELKRQQFQEYLDCLNEHSSIFEKYVSLQNFQIKDEKIFFKLLKMGVIFIDFIDAERRSFFKLSHGERKFFTDSLLLYHEIFNHKENNILIFLDEPDLTLHPEWQRKYLLQLFQFMKHINTKQFHIVITSHSPFILSDIPKENVIFLEDGKQVYPDIDTFGANIHTLLSHGFFMQDGLMGEFAKEKINQIINYLNDKGSEMTNNETAQKYINIIGEPILKRQLQKMLDSKRISRIDEIDELKRRIAILESQQ